MSHSRFTARCTRFVAVFVLLLAAALPALSQATPPSVINYQGVLRDASDVPLDGSFDMVFRFWSAETAGDEILADRHLEVDGRAVTVSGGLFSVVLGTGELLDGSGPGTYGSLAEVFRDYGDVWLEVQIGSETLSPRIRVAAAGYALNAAYLAGRAAGEFLDTSSSPQTKFGLLSLEVDGDYGVRAAGTSGGGLFEDKGNSGFARVGFGNEGIHAAGNARGGHFEDLDGSGFAYVGDGHNGISASGNIVGGYFTDRDSSGWARVGFGDDGIQAYGNITGGYFADLDSSGYAQVGFGDEGIHAAGNLRGGRFEDSNGSGVAYVGDGDQGIYAAGNARGGHFEDLDGSGFAYVGDGDNGISASGNVVGGYFTDADGSGWARVGYGDDGIQAYGNITGGYFADLDSSGYAQVGFGDEGIHAAGNLRGGRFEDSNGSGFAYVGDGDQGIYAAGNLRGGHFQDLNGSGFAYVGDGDNGISASGNVVGGYFTDADESGWARVGFGDDGIQAYGNHVGGRFDDTDNSSWAYVSFSTYKIYGSGSVAFVQNHPEDPSKVVVYNAPESSEVAVYTRGSARLVGGQASVELDPTFAWVTNPDVGLTAHLTPRGRSCPMHVVTVSTSTLVAGSDDPDCADAVFDYMVWGLRIGFEESTPVQLKTQEAPIPSMRHHRELVAGHPELARFTAIERFKAMAQQVSPGATVDLSRAQALVEAVHEFDPETDALPLPPDPAEGEPALPQPAEPAAPGRAPGFSESADPGRAVVPSAAPDREGAHDTSALPPGAAWFPLAGEAEPGDLLALDPDDASRLRRARQDDAPAVVGVAAAPARPQRDGSDGLEIPVLGSGFAKLKVDAGYGSILPGDVLAVSPTPGHAMRAIEIVPGTVVAKALEPLDAGMGTIRVLILPR